MTTIRNIARDGMMMAALVAAMAGSMIVAKGIAAAVVHVGGMAFG